MKLSVLLVAGVIGVFTLMLVLAPGCGERKTVVVREYDAGPPPAVVVAPPPPQTVIVVREAPPPIRIERRPPPPPGVVIWIDGYWHVDRGKYVWMAGHYEKPPHAKAVWIASHYDKGPQGYEYHPGHWSEGGPGGPPPKGK